MTKTTINNNESILVFLSSILSILKREYKVVLLLTFLFPIIGFFYILSIPKEFIACSKIMPEVLYKASDGMAGINQVLKKYNNNVDLYNTEITSSELYAEILKTNDFYDYIFNKKLKINNNEVSFKSYCEYNLQNKNIFSRKGKSYSTVTREDVEKRIVITTSKKNNLILVTVNMPDPSVAADIANFTTVYFIDYIVRYRTQKARQKLHFIEHLQKDISKDSVKSEDLTKEIQNSLSVLTVQMKIQIQEDTPIFQILEKAQPTVRSSEPSMAKMLSSFIFSGFLIGIVIAFLRNNNYKIFLN